MIPKIIHYCWFGGNPLPEDVKAYLKSWKEFCPDFEIIQWNENNFDISQNEYCKEAHEARKWAFVSDYARLKILYDHGGIYMDTDVEVVKSLRPLLKYNAFSGFEDLAHIPTGTMGACKGNEWIWLLLKYYDGRHFKDEQGKYDLTTNVLTITDLTVKEYGLQLDGTKQIFGDNCIMLPSDYLCAKSYRTQKVYKTDNTYTIHHFKGSWLDAPDQTKDIIDMKILDWDRNAIIKKFQNITWEDFVKVSVDKHLFLFGFGLGLEFYFYKYGNHAGIEGIIDNDIKIQGYEYKPIAEEPAKQQQGIRITGMEILEDYDPAKVCVLICSLNYYNEIARQLEQKHIENYFSLFCMEAYSRLQKKSNLKVPSIVHAAERMISNNKVAIISAVDGAGHAKTIVTCLHKTKPNLDIVWLYKDLRVPVPEGIRAVPYKDKHACIYELETAKLWMSDEGVPFGVKKKEHQTYVQLKHWPSITLKTFGFDEARYRNDWESIFFMEEQHSMIDYIIVGSKFDEISCRSGFNFSGEVFYAGSPRSDILFADNDIPKTVKRYYGIGPEKKILLYVPTFRLQSRRWDLISFSCQLDFEMIKNNLEKKFGGEWVILLRLHPHVAKLSKKIQKPKYVIDASSYYDSEELVAAADAVISDYSSIMFEPAFVHKPVFLFADDLDSYVKQDRQFLIDYSSLPFPIAATNEDLAKNIDAFNQDKYMYDVDAFMEKYGVHEDGHASERAAQFILDLIDGKIVR